MMPRTPSTAIVLALGVIVAAACGGTSEDSSSGSDKQQGTEGGSCYPNSTCNEGLVCLSHLCVSPGTAGSGGGIDASAGGSPGLGGAAGSGGVAGQGGSAGQGTGGAVPPDSSTDDGASAEAEAGCSAIIFAAEPVPLDLYFMVDRSGSMSGDPWTKQAAALKSFLGAPQSAGLSVAMNFFPAVNDALSPSCDGTSFASPLVFWADLPGNYSALAGVIDSVEPLGTTPTQDALNGVLLGARDRQLQQPRHIVAAVIVSDGEPCCGECPIEDDNGIGAIAAKYANGSPPIKTFAVVVDPAATGVMTSIAQKGGTGQPYDATGGSQAFLDALNTIHSVAGACKFKFPEGDGGKVDASKLGLQLAPGNGGPPVPFPYVGSETMCPGTMGWYYDDANDPSQVMLCPAACDAVKQDGQGHVDILLGCTGS